MIFLLAVTIFAGAIISPATAVDGTLFCIVCLSLILFMHTFMHILLDNANADVPRLRTRTRGGQGGGVDEDNCTFNGNGFPKGKAAFKLNILGRDLERREEWNFNPQGDRSVAIRLEGKTKILLESSDDTDTDCYDQCARGFCVADPNGTDGSAKICLRDPFASDEPCNGGNSNCDEEATYRIFARVRGKGNINFELCVEDSDDGPSGHYCDLGASVTINRKKATDISQELLTLCVDNVGVGLFDQLCFDGDDNLIPCDDNDTGGINEQYFWDVNNDGVRNAELRFYEQTFLDSLFEGTECTWDAVSRRNAC